MKKRQDWEGKAMIVACSLDSDKDELLKRIKDRGWENVHNLWAGSSAWKSAAATAFSVNGIPDGWVIDKNGVIVANGHPASLPFEELLDKLIANGGEFDPIIVSQEKTDDDGGERKDGLTKWRDLSDESRANLLKVVRSRLSEELSSKVTLSDILVRTYSNKAEKIVRSIQISGLITNLQEDQFKSQFKEIKEDLKNIDPASVSIYIRTRTMPTPLTVPSHCSACKADLTSQPVKYLCAYCEEAYASCETCFNSLLKKTNTNEELAKHAIHPFYHFFSSSQSLSKVLFGPKVFVITPNESEAESGGEVAHECFCDECKSRGRLQGIRWKCSQCVDYDRCSKCYSSFIGQQDPAASNSSEQAIPTHDSSHVFVRIPTPETEYLYPSFFQTE